ncbi:Gfo/Idh/MocA family oxidoreductase [Lentzea sp. NBRC 102530]|uniref:Gfo/Idh/MocA family protein n=1 Tax=Lentzea sp. NBRC 102530 TaxID=3032201 RepID=UPI0024A185BD|nr:Gfo/Idh/MocA family oxidoreductase [Lentzea sp. NBRC 102530]GLY49788.1 oxidoreductase [Lentzea sp. NBRC 102530]
MTGVPDRPLRFGVLGCASVAWRRFLPAVRHVPGVRLVAVASRDAGRAARFAREFDCLPVTGYRELLRRDDVDAVYLPVPTGLHAEWAVEAVEAGKHVLVEKPLATNRADAEQLLTLAARTGRCVAENRMFVHHPQHDAVRKLVADDAIGELRVFNAAMAIPPLPSGNVRLDPALGGGALLDVGYYPIHAALLHLGSDLEVVGAVLRRSPHFGVDVGGSVLLRDRDGVSAHLVFGFEHHYGSHYELWGATGRISLDHAFTPPPARHPLVRVERAGGTEELRLPAADQFRESITSFARAVREGGVHPDVLAATIRGLELVDTVREAA